MSEERKEGIAAAVGEALEILGTDLEALPEQLALPSLESDAAPPPQDGRGESTGKPGRPKGARNKRTEDWTTYILARYRSPLLFMADTYSRPVNELATFLHCDREDAFKIQQSAASNLAPYLHQRQAQAIQIEGKAAINLTISGLDENPGEVIDGDEMRILDAIIVNPEDVKKSNT